MGSPRVRMSDVASHAGVSIATVSRVVNDSESVTSETRDKVLSSMESLGYEWNDTSEPENDDKLIAIIIPEITNPIFSTFADALQREISSSNFIPFICSQSAGTYTEEVFVDTFLGRGLRAVVFVSGRHADYRANTDLYSFLHKKQIPFITINGDRDDISATDFSTADAAGIRTAVTHLKNLGHEKIALVTGEQCYVPARKKVEAFSDIMRSTFNVDSPLVIETFYTSEAVAALVPSLIEEGVSGVITSSDVQALGIIEGARAIGLSIPKDLSVIGYDDSAPAKYYYPPLTTIRQPVSAICSDAVRILTLSIEHKVQHTGSFIYSPDLVVRSTTGPVSHARS
ncbi:LacI family DNA-binding transcriptional regulator [Arcanobacterium phocae]|uniref:LacI family DNA-binding transcriptional regulator n=1 Tax=Arcanobacterium phocae TaxID=131112 RepID=UPI001C0E9A23|nr:LacI family DNA-binding transcriptional regulator [Arcanobacterium phocae]